MQRADDDCDGRPSTDTTCVLDPSDARATFTLPGVYFSDGTDVLF